MVYKPDSAVKTIVYHYSATPIESDFTAADIDRMHRNRGFAKIGYHYYIRKDGTVENGRDMSKDGKFEQGAHCRGSNHNSIGICLEGGVTKDNRDIGVDNRTDAQKAALIKLTKKLLIRYPSACVKGHKDMPNASTQCPAYDAASWWSEASSVKPIPQVAQEEAETPSLGWVSAIFRMLGWIK